MIALDLRKDVIGEKDPPAGRPGEVDRRHTEAREEIS